MRISIIGKAFFLCLFATLLIPSSLLSVGQAQEANAQQKKDSSMTAEYSVVVEKDGVTAWLELNDVPIDRWKKRDKQNVGILVNPWLRPGKNSLRLRIGWSDDLPYKSGDGRITATVVMNHEAKLADEPKELARIVWPEAKGIEKYPTERSVDFEAPTAPPTELWTKAEKIELSESTRKGVFDLVMEIQQALEEKNIDKVMKLLEFKTREMSKAVYMSDSEGEKSHRKFLDAFFKSDQDKKWVMKPIKEKEIEYHLAGGGLIVWVCRNEFLPLFENPRRMSIHAYIAKIDGKWMVVR